VRLFTRNANDFTDPFIATAVAELPVKSCLIDGEAIVCDENGLAVFDLIRRHGTGESAVLSAFDLLELDGKDLRRKPIEERKRLLAKLLKGSHSSMVLNEHYEEDGAIVFREACRLGCEGIVSKNQLPHALRLTGPRRRTSGQGAAFKFRGTGERAAQAAFL
jgi:bifunctional non-homologous end joining protein LigD